MARTVEFLTEACDYGNNYEFVATGIRRMYMLSPSIVRVTFVHKEISYEGAEEDRVSAHMDRTWIWTSPRRRRSSPSSPKASPLWPSNRLTLRLLRAGAWPRIDRCKTLRNRSARRTLSRRVAGRGGGVASKDTASDRPPKLQLVLPSR